MDDKSFIARAIAWIAALPSRLPYVLQEAIAIVIMAILAFGVVYKSLHEWSAVAAFAFSYAKVAMAGAMFFLIDVFVLHRKLDTGNEIKNGNVAAAIWAAGLFLGICYILSLE